MGREGRGCRQWSEKGLVGPEGEDFSRDLRSEEV